MRFKNEVTEQENETTDFNVDGGAGGTGNNGGTELRTENAPAEPEAQTEPAGLAKNEGTGTAAADEVQTGRGGNENEPVEQTERGKRGRKPGGKNKPKTEAEDSNGEGGKGNEPKKTVDILKDIPNVQPPPVNAVPVPPPSKKVDVSKFVSGALMLSLIDSIAPHLVIKAASLMGKDKFKDVDPDALKLDASERKELAPLADEAVKEMLGEMSPTAALLIALGILYGGKLMVEAS